MRIELKMVMIWRAARQACQCQASARQSIKGQLVGTGGLVWWLFSFSLLEKHKNYDSLYYSINSLPQNGREENFCRKRESLFFPP